MSHRLIAVVQYRENYGTAEKPYWKFKGGHNVLVAQWNDAKDIPGPSDLQGLVNVARPVIEKQTECQETWIITWELVFSGEMTSDEKMFEEMLRDGYAEPHERYHYVPRTLEECKVCPF